MREDNRDFRRIVEEVASRLAGELRPAERLIDELEFMRRLGIASRETFERYKEHSDFPPSVVPYSSNKRAPQARYREETVNEFIRGLDREARARRTGDRRVRSIRSKRPS